MFLLGIFSKILEKCIKYQLNIYLQKEKIISSDQHGFRQNTPHTRCSIYKGSSLRILDEKQDSHNLSGLGKSL